MPTILAGVFNLASRVSGKLPNPYRCVNHSVCVQCEAEVGVSASASIEILFYDKKFYIKPPTACHWLHSLA